MTILLEIHINAAITGLKHQRHMETEFPCAVEQATAQALLLCKGFLSVIVHEYIFIPSCLLFCHSWCRIGSPENSMWSDWCLTKALSWGRLKLPIED